MASRSTPVICASVGAFLVLCYWVLSLAEVANIGQDTDIGGGFILLAGYALTVGGVITLVIRWLGQKLRHEANEDD